MSDSPAPGPVFFSDLSFPNQLYGVLVRSTIQRGYLVDIKPPTMPDGYHLYTATDVPGENRITVAGTNIPIFTPYEINYYGEPLGILVGPDQETVQELVAAVLVETEILSPLTVTDSFPSSQIVAKRVHFFGDPDRKIDRSKNIFETVCETSTQDHFYAEPLGVAVTVSSQQLDVYCATQWPYHVRAAVSAVLDLDPSEIRIHPTALGEPLDGKIWFPSLLAAQAALASVLSRHPVLLAFSRQEDFLFSVKSAPARVQYRTILDDKNALKAMSVRIVINAGGYSPLINEIVDRMTIAALGPYYCPEFKVETFALKTNLPPMGAFSGWGEAQVSFALENHIARLLSQLNISPTEWKLQNFIDRGRKTPTGHELKQTRRYEELFDIVCNKSDFYRKYTAYEHLNRERKNLTEPPLRGIAIVCGFQNNGFSAKTPPGGKYAASVTMDTDGQVHISAAITSESMRKITRNHAAQILELEKDLIHFTDDSNDFLLMSGPETLSGKLTVLLPLVEKCCATLQKQRFRNPLPITVKKTYKPSRTDDWDGTVLHGNPYISETPAVCVVEVELDPLTWTPHVRKAWFAIDAGKILDEKIVLSAVRKSFSAAYSKTIAEYLILRDGKFTPGDSVQYDILQPAEMPSVDIQLLESAEPPKGVGSIPYLLFPAAFSAALFQIIWQGLTSLPIRPEDIYTLIGTKEEIE